MKLTTIPLQDGHVVNILGTPYTLKVCSENEDPRLSEIDGLCDETAREMLANNYQTSKDEPTAKKNLLLQTKKVIRHEIVHAFLFESGLAECSDWAQNEEMVDWIAKQGPKIVEAWKQAGAL